MIAEVVATAALKTVTTPEAPAGIAAEATVARKTAVPAPVEMVCPDMTSEMIPTLESQPHTIPMSAVLAEAAVAARTPIPVVAVVTPRQQLQQLQEEWPTRKATKDVCMEAIAEWDADITIAEWITE